MRQDCDQKQRIFKMKANQNFYLLNIILLCGIIAAQKEEGDPCEFKTHLGICKAASACPHLPDMIKQFGLKPKDVVRCGFNTYEEIICCPPLTSTGTGTGTDSNTGTTTKTRSDLRPAVRACKEIDAGLEPLLTTHILGGTPVELGEFPHMAAIGFQSGLSPTESFDCGGTLIDSRFVLTAAHCLVTRDRKPVVVRLGVTNFSSVEQMKDVVEVRVKQIHLHPDYTSNRVYNDIGLVELEHNVTYSANVYPTCLYTDLNDPPSNVPLYVSGWGVINTRTRERSNVLLKAKQSITPLQQCNEVFVENGLTRQINQGIISSQLCAHDPGLTKDACQGDSGGPLNLVEDESLNKYRVVGVISTGFSCASATPGLYTRVAAFLDYIESIVWPSR